VLEAKEGQDVYVTETIYDRETGFALYQHTKLNGLRESPPDGSPSLVHFDEFGRVSQKCWHKQDKPHRLDAPSTIAINPENGVHIVELFEQDGHPRDPKFGPSMIKYNRETGEVEEYEYADGKTRKPTPKTSSLEPKI
jgi:hypothetical protein